MEVPLTRELLQIIVTVQAYKKFCQQAHVLFSDMLKKPHDWQADLKGYFFTFPSDIIRRNHLTTTTKCLNAILDFNVKDGMENLPAHQLARLRLVV